MSLSNVLGCLYPVYIQQLCATFVEISVLLYMQTILQIYVVHNIMYVCVIHTSTSESTCGHLLLTCSLLRPQGQTALSTRCGGGTRTLSG